MVWQRPHPAPRETFPCGVPWEPSGGPSRLQALAATRWSEEAGGDWHDPGGLGASCGSRGEAGLGRLEGGAKPGRACVLQAAAIRNATDLSRLDGGVGAQRPGHGKGPPWTPDP